MKPQFNGGWIRLYRSLLEHERRTDPEWVALWVHFLLSAAFTSRNVIWQGQPHHLFPGQFISTLSEISQQTGIARPKVHRLIQQMKMDMQIETLESSKNSMFTVLNWGSFQESETLDSENRNAKRNASKTRKWDKLKYMRPD